MLLLSSLPVGCVLPLGEVVRSAVAQASSSGLGALGTGSATVGGGAPARSICRPGWRRSTWVGES
jgi:hypothetical protein